MPTLGEVPREAKHFEELASDFYAMCAETLQDYSSIFGRFSADERRHADAIGVVAKLISREALLSEVGGELLAAFGKCKERAHELSEVVKAIKDRSGVGREIVYLIMLSLEESAVRFYGAPFNLAPAEAKDHLKNILDNEVEHCRTALNLYEGL